MIFMYENRHQASFKGCFSAFSNFVPASVAEYFSPMVITGVLRVYAEQLAIVRDHPLTQRRYMWKLEY